MAIGKQYYDLVYLEGQVLEGIPKFDGKTFPGFGQIVHNRRGSLDNKKGNTQWAELQ